MPGITLVLRIAVPLTYWEEDIPPRIDLGKLKYGGPFTTEEVEDTNDILLHHLLLFSLLGFHLSGHGYSLLDQLTRTQCPSVLSVYFIADTNEYHTASL